MVIGQEEIGRRIRHAREDADLTQQQLADRIGIQTAQSISRYERGETEVSTKRLRKIAEATGKDLDFFVQDPDLVGRAVTRGASGGPDLDTVLARVEEVHSELQTVRGLLESLLEARSQAS